MIPVISVIVPAYNEEKYLPKCLTALIHQDFPLPYEIIVIDNNSTDKTSEIAKKMKVKLFSERKRGYIHAIKKGFDEAKSEIIAMTDADTIVPPNWLARIYQTYQSDPQIVGLSGGYDFDKKFWLRDFLKEINIFVFSFFKTFSGFNMSFKKGALLEVGGVNLKINLGTDVYISRVLKKVGKCLYLKDLRVVTSSRRYDKPNIFYLLNNFLTYLSLLIFKKTAFQHFRAIR